MLRINLDYVSARDDTPKAVLDELNRCLQEEGLEPTITDGGYQPAALGEHMGQPMRETDNATASPMIEEAAAKREPETDNFEAIAKQHAQRLVSEYKGRTDSEKRLTEGVKDWSVVLTGVFNMSKSAVEFAKEVLRVFGG